MNELYISGGKQKYGTVDGDTWGYYELCRLFSLDRQLTRASPLLDYVSPADACFAEDPSITYKAGSLLDQEFWLTSETEVMCYHIPDLKRLHYISLPCFNDLHHVLARADGTLVVAVTGLDLVIQMDRSGRVLREWNTTEESTWSRFSRSIDYRKIPSTKPHKVHPNYVFGFDDAIWVTRFHQQDCLSLTHPERRIELKVGRPHDGMVYRDSVYFTTVNGFIVKVSPRQLRVEEVFDLNTIKPRSELLGWCRGLWIENDLAWVGFSRLRPTKFRENLSWIKHGFQKVHNYNTLPTRVACYDLSRRHLVAELDLEPLGMNAVFSILPVP